MVSTTIEHALAQLRIEILQEAVDAIAPNVPDNEPGKYYEGLLVGKARVEELITQAKNHKDSI